MGHVKEQLRAREGIETGIFVPQRGKRLTVSCAMEGQEGAVSCHRGKTGQFRAREESSMP